MFKDKNILVVGMARSGIACAELLVNQGAIVTINDSKSFDACKSSLGKLSERVVLDFGGPPKNIKSYDLIVMSPGVPKDLPFVLEAEEANVKVTGALEVGYCLSKGHFYGITGTNGKTTTTTLTYDIFKAAKKDVYAVGNIGNPLASVAPKTTDDSHLVTEVSSFQLESTETFNVHIAAILNLAPDHLNRHKTMDAYVAAKCRLFENQVEGDILLLNYDDGPTRKLAKDDSQTTVIYFSKTPLEKGIYVEDGMIVSDLDEKVAIIPVSDIKVPGRHNLENVLAAVAIAHLAGIQTKYISEAVKAFRGVEHRIEYVGTYKDVICYNDSKATNPESAIVAVESMTKPTVLIAGGMDKGSEFDAFTKTFKGVLKHLILLGETKEILKKSSLDNNFENITFVNTMDEAVRLASEIATSGDAILLSPACASWDMYPSFEVRGEHFKTCIKKELK